MLYRALQAIKTLDLTMKKHHASMEDKLCFFLLGFVAALTLHWSVVLWISRERVWSAVTNNELATLLYDRNSADEQQTNEDIKEIENQLDVNSNLNGNLEMQMDIRNCSIITDQVCYWSIVSKDYFNIFLAESMCEAYGGSLAVIPDAKSYQVITEDVRSKLLPGYIAMSLWTGMKTNLLQYGDDASYSFYVKWHPGYPERELPNLESIFLVVDRNYSSEQQGLMNGFVLSTSSGVVCQKT